jgi:hypothetical protein
MSGLLVLAALGLSQVARSAEASGALDVQRSMVPGGWEVFFNGRRILVYSTAPWTFKPYVRELSSLNGTNVLRDSPHDHPHHHGLMYGIMISGINFWEEMSGSGVQKPVETLRPEVGTVDVGGETLPQAKLSQLLHWLTPQDAFLPDTNALALLIERRTLSLTLNPAEQEVALEWESRFEVGCKANAVTLSGHNYHGLGMRFRADLDPLAVPSVGGVRPEFAGRPHDLSVAPWASVSFNPSQDPVLVVLAGHPSNARGDPAFFSMVKPFAYLSATQRLDQKPLVYHTGERFALHYLILLYSETRSADDLERRIQRWLSRNR